jgi:lipopolysaccharide/colanic/teichoic acid biosynthesis glycosyltransferase
VTSLARPVPADPAVRLHAYTDDTPAPIPGRTRPAYLHLKRVIDLTLALALLVALSPVLALIALLVLIDSGRPVFFVQPRAGARPQRVADGMRWERTTFRMIKFRTMMVGAHHSRVHEEFVRAFVAGETPQTRSLPAKLTSDPRITRVGRILRATSLDELPQLFNVLAGSMSLVGPRPVPTYEAACYEDRHLERLAARPGLTGPWQVDGRGRVSFEEMIHMDVHYVRCQSLRVDLIVLTRTLPAVISRRGAV